jgi:hypothetical protein
LSTLRFTDWHTFSNIAPITALLRKTELQIQRVGSLPMSPRKRRCELGYVASRWESTVKMFDDLMYR